MGNTEKKFWDSSVRNFNKIGGGIVGYAEGSNYGLLWTKLYLKISEAFSVEFWQLL
jgi:hypothetical protein